MAAMMAVRVMRFRPFPQGLKPIFFLLLFGTAEVVP
jgi:hypothetical protein